MLKARDIMKKNVTTVTPETSVEELGRLLIEKDISGAPVTDKSGRLVGIVTENDLISQNKQFHIPTVLRIFDALIPLDTDSKVEAEIRRMAASTVGEICTRDVITVDEDTSLPEIASVMVDKKIHLLPVLRGDDLVGIIGKRDIIRGTTGAS
ncbi:MAG: CBS domain-containing protein [Nitrospirota bacterium]|nr:MAG: CBS domain-containing protein [Nitrospirota bacterium]